MPSVELTLPQVAVLVEAARDQAAIYRDSEDADSSLRLQRKARSLETAAQRLLKVQDAQVVLR